MLPLRLSLAAVFLLCAATETTASHASNARWLVHNLSYGVLSTTSVQVCDPTPSVSGRRFAPSFLSQACLTDHQYDGVAFGNPQSFVDGTLDNSTGNLYMYVSGLDASMIDIAAKPEVSFTLSEVRLCTFSRAAIFAWIRI